MSTVSGADPAGPRRWARARFPLLLLALLGLGMVGHLGLQTRIQEQGFELAGLQSQVASLGAQAEILQAAVDKQSTPQQLAYAAAHLGMVANPYTTFVHLPDGHVTGSNTAVKGNEEPIISAAPTLPGATTPIDVVDKAAASPNANGATR